MANPVIFSPDLSSSISYSPDELPIFTSDEGLQQTGDINVPHHWHSDLEFVYLEEGKADFFVNGKTIPLLPGQGIFVNSRCLHYAHEYTECKAVLVRIHPIIFTGNYKQGADYYTRKFGRGEPNYIFFDPTVPWHRDALAAIVRVRECALNIENRPISVLLAVYNLIELVGDHIAETTFTEKDNRDYNIYLEMVKYIHENFGKKVNIDEMAQELHLSRTKAYRLFEKYAHSSPNVYLNSYRLAMSQQSLRDTDLTITEIAAKCGFQTSSYFTKIFGKETGISPRVYRDKYKDK